MTLRKLEELKFTELDSLDRTKTLFTITVSPLEEHGPHLPLGVDLFNGQYFADEISERFLKKYPDWNVIEIPSIAVGSFAFDAPGTLKVRPKIIRELLIDTLSSLAKYEFKYFMISNAHGRHTYCGFRRSGQNCLQAIWSKSILIYRTHRVGISAR